MNMFLLGQPSILSLLLLHSYLLIVDFKQRPGWLTVYFAPRNADLAQAAIRRCCRVGGLNNRHSCLTVLGWKVQDQGATWFGSWWEPSSCLTESCLLALLSHSWGQGVGKGAALLSSSSYEDTDPTMEASPSWPYLHLITSQRLHMLIPSHWEFRFQHVNLGRKQT